MDKVQVLIHKDGIVIVKTYNENSAIVRPNGKIQINWNNGPFDDLKSVVEVVDAINGQLDEGTSYNAMDVEYLSELLPDAEVFDCNKE